MGSFLAPTKSLRSAILCEALAAGGIGTGASCGKGVGVVCGSVAPSLWVLGASLVAQAALVQLGPPVLLVGQEARVLEDLPAYEKVYLTWERKGRPSVSV